MARVPLLLLLTLTILPSRAIAQRPPHEEILRSGRKIRVVTVQWIEIKRETGVLESALMLEYETEMKDVDEARLKKEIDEVWAWFKRDVEHQRHTLALIDVDLPSGVRYSGQTKFSFERQPDGSWKSLVR